MKKTLVLSFLFIIGANWLWGQAPHLMVSSDAKGLYLDHVVQRGQTYYAIGRRYHLSPDAIAAFNRLSINTPLEVGQHLKVPLTTENFSQEERSGAPVYYKVNKGEGLYRVGVNNNNVSLDHLRAWNQLAGDNISVGQNLIIGFLVEGGAATAPVTTSNPPPEATKTVVEEKKPEVRKEDPPVQTREEPRQSDPVKEESKSNPPPVVTPPVGAVNSEAGYFKSWFDQQQKTKSAGKELTVTSGIFKTASGWQDAKYYLLIDKVEPGTIVRITNPSNNKTVYAKVLGEMSGIRQNQGLDIRMSNAAASILGIADTDKFVVQLNY